MMKKCINLAFIVFFTIIIIFPLLTTNLSNEKISEAENRYLAKFPNVFTEDGSLNENFINGFESWINDNIGFRDLFLQTNALLQYNVFNNIDLNNHYLGVSGDLNYATTSILKNYQRFDLLNNQGFEQIANSHQIISNWLNSRSISYFYMQCYDKHTIYPEQFMSNVNQYGADSRAQKIVDYLKSNTMTNIINVYDPLVKSKDTYETYSNWGDPTHWTDRGAFIGYQTMMKSMNETLKIDLKILEEEDYNISNKNIGKKLYGVIHQEDYNEVFELVDPHAQRIDNNLTYLSDDNRHHYYVNETSLNDERLLIIGDSYIASYIAGDIAESFKETILIWGDYLYQLPEIIDAYSPTIVVFECAERVDRTSLINKLASRLTSDY